MTEKIPNDSKDVSSRHVAAELLFQVFQFLCQRFGVGKDQLTNIRHFSDVPRTWQGVRLAEHPVEIAYSDPLPSSLAVEPGNTWEKFAVLKIGPIGSVIEDESDVLLLTGVVEILAGPYNAPILEEDSPADSWDIRVDSLNCLSQVSVGEPYALVAFTALAGISALLLKSKATSLQQVLSDIMATKELPEV